MCAHASDHSDVYAGDGHPPIGAQTSFCPSRHSIQQQTAEDLIPVKVSTTDVIPEERDEHVRDEHHSVGHSHGGGRAALSSANSTVILQHLLDLKQNANFGPKQVDPHDVQDVENMLEAYSLQADYLLAQLQALSKELDDFQVLLRHRFVPYESIVSIEFDILCPCVWACSLITLNMFHKTLPVAALVLFRFCSTQC
jgi:hypothetical protein